MKLRVEIHRPSGSYYVVWFDTEEDMWDYVSERGLEYDFMAGWEEVK